MSATVGGVRRPVPRTREARRRVDRRASGAPSGYRARRAPVRAPHGHSVSNDRPATLSVAADRIGLTTMSAANLLGGLAAERNPVERADAGVVGLYPAASLDVRGFDPRRYEAPG